MVDMIITAPLWIQIALGLCLLWLYGAGCYVLGYGQASKFHRERYDVLKRRLHASNYGLSEPPAQKGDRDPAA